jgi:hypothetical protein
MRNLLLKKNLLNYLVFAVLLISILCRVDTARIFNSLYTDQVFHLLTSESFKKGEGHVSQWADPNDLSQEVNGTFAGYKRGYHVLLAALPGKAFNMALLVDAIAISLLLLCIFYLFKKLLNLRTKTILLFFLFFGLTYTPFNYLSSTDLLVYVSFTFAITFFIYMFKYDKYSYLHFFILGFLAFIPPFFKLSATPVLLIFPVSLGVIAFFKKDKSLYLKTLFVLVVSSLFLFLDFQLLGFQSKGREVEYGLYFFQLSRIAAFPFESFFFSEAIIEKVKSINSIAGLLARAITLLISLSFLVVIYYVFYLSIKKMRSSIKLDLLGIFCIAGGVTIIGILSYLALLSIFIPGETWQIPYWTFVENTRYYAPAIIFIQIIIFILAFEKTLLTNKIVKTSLQAFIFGSIVFSGLYWANQNYKYYIHNNKQYTFEWNHAHDFAVANAIDELVKNYPERSVYVSNDNLHSGVVKLLSDVSISSGAYQTIIQNGIKSSEPILFIILMPDEKSEIEKDFINKNSLIKKINIENNELYYVNFQQTL